MVEICKRDREVFGADRSQLLTCLWRDGPQYTAMARSASGIAGYIMGRAGARAHYIGPWVANPGSGAAEILFQEVLGRFDKETFFVDICAGNPEAAALVKKAGFRYQRDLTRMFRGPNRYPGNYRCVCGIAGPELG